MLGSDGADERQFSTCHPLPPRPAPSQIALRRKMPIYDHDYKKLVDRTAPILPTTLHTALRPPLYRGASARESTPLGLRGRIRVGDATLEDKYRNTRFK